VWLEHTSPRERRTLLAGFLGYAVDGFDFMIYTFVIPTLITVLGMTRAQAGYLATAALVTSAAGGWAAGILADRYGRVRMLQITVLWFAAFTCVCGFARSYPELLTARALQGFGIGGEWSVGSVLVAETVAARYRGRAAGLVQSSWAVGWAGAALAYALVYAWAPPALAWKILFWLGIAPAFLVLYVRRQVVESRVPVARRVDPLDIFRPPLLRTTALCSLLCTGLLGGYYSVTTWLPTYLATERHLSVGGTSTYLLVLIGGSFTGYLTSAWFSDAVGRRRGFMVFALGGMLLISTYTHLAASDAVMLLLGFPLGFFISGIFSGTGALLTELFPDAVRGSGQGFCYNIGRALGAVCPALIGAASGRGSLGAAIAGVTVAAYVLVIAAAWALPETRGRVLATAPV
jgi:MFS family permease